ncbi:hypothetical protein EB001_09155 [bacterium]|jgi:hypothetical protein|nr:hypothetical protein [bacterium]
MARVTINLYNLWVEIEQENTYPDQITDMTNRCLLLFQSATLTCKEMKIDIKDDDFEIEDYEE